VEQKAQGFVEVTGYVAAIEAADAMAKAAEVVIALAHKVDGPDVCVICEGDVAACKAAVSAGEAISRAKGALMATNIIPRPDQGAEHLYTLMNEMQARKAAKKAERIARREAVLGKLAEGAGEKSKTVSKKAASKKTALKK
jgi:microcompartment protein CcmL/EutN